MITGHSLKQHDSTLPQLQNNRKQLLVVFRKSDHELRFAHITKDDQNESFYEAEGL